MSQLKDKLSETSSVRSLKAVRSILKKEESKLKTNNRLRFDDSSLSRVYIFDMEDPDNCMEVHSLSSQDLKLGLMDCPGLVPSEEKLKQIREAREKEFKLKRKKHHHNEFTLVKIAKTDEEDLEASLNPISLGHENKL